MKHYQHLIIGGGLTGDAAVRGIRELDTTSSIGMLSMEPHLPYMRPSLSKGLWKGRPIDKIWRNTQTLGVEISLDSQVLQLDSWKKIVRDAKGNEYSYENVLLATGGSPLRLPFGGEDIIYFRDLQDYERLRALSAQGSEFLVIGGGFIGAELAAALTLIGKKVIMVFPEAAIGTRIFPKDLAQHLNTFYRQQGVTLVTNEVVTGLERHGAHFKVHTRGGHEFTVSGVVAGIGLRPNLDLAQQSGLQIDNGIVVDAYLRTSRSNVYAAGDVANFFHVGLGKRVRVEHEDNALKMGKIAGRNMAGANEQYTHIPLFYSDLFDLGYEAVGELNSEMESVADWQEPFHKGVVYYLEQGRVRGVLLWNVWKQVELARALLSEAGPFKPADLRGRLK